MRPQIGAWYTEDAPPHLPLWVRFDRSLEKIYVYTLECTYVHTLLTTCKNPDLRLTDDQFAKFNLGAFLPATLETALSSATKSPSARLRIRSNYGWLLGAHG